MTWDIAKIKKNRTRGGKPVKAFKGGRCRPFKSRGAAKERLGISNYFFYKHIDSGEPINGYIIEWA